MNTLVCVKAGFSPQGLAPPQNGTLQPEGYLMPNRADECAIALAAGLRKQNGGSVTLVSVAPSHDEEVLDFYVGLGADAIIRVWEDLLTGADARAIAYVLSNVAKMVQPEIIICGDSAFGGEGSGLIGPLLAEILGWPFLGGLVEVSLNNDLDCFRLMERGDRQHYKVKLPAVIAASPEMETTRYPSFMTVRAARRELLDLGSLGVDCEELERLFPTSDQTTWVKAKPRARKLFTPPSTASAADRMRMIIGGGQARKAQTNLLEGAPGKLAQQIIEFLRQERLL
jgi:electron transfer flavoprotein beta subunit